jgi:hypothetical protein
MALKSQLIVNYLSHECCWRGPHKLTAIMPSIAQTLNYVVISTLGQPISGLHLRCKSNLDPELITRLLFSMCSVSLLETQTTDWSL